MKRFVLTLLLVFAAAPIFSFRFYPIVKDFAPAGPGATQNFYVENTTDKRIAVQITIVSRTVDVLGEERYTDAGDEFFVYPSQMILEADTQQTVRVQWLGAADLTAEAPYRIVAEQLPVNFGGENSEGGQIDIMFRYLGAIYILPDSVAPEVSVESAEVLEGGDQLRLVLHNAGNAHAILRDLVVEIDGGDLILQGEALDGVAGENVLGGSRRQFDVALPRRYSEGRIDVEIRFTETR